MGTPSSIVLFVDRASFQRIHDFCRAVYLQTFGPEEGLRRFKKLPLIQAIQLCLDASQSSDP